MKPLEYLFFAISLGCYKKLQWIVSVFTVSVETESQAKSLYPGKLIREPFGLFFYDEKLEKKQIIIDSKDVNRALFHKYDKITINGALLGDRGGFVGVGDIHTTIGRLLLNLLSSGQYHPEEESHSAAWQL